MGRKLNSDTKTGKPLVNSKNSTIIVTRTRVNPNKEQYTKLSSHYGANRFTYNFLLGDYNEEYKHWEEDFEKGLATVDDKPSSTEYSFRKRWMANRETVAEWYTQNNDRTYRSASAQLAKAFENFYAKRAKYPKFKNRNSKQSFSMEGNIKIVDNHRIYITKVGSLKTFESLSGINWLLKMGSTIQEGVLTREPDGKDYISIRLRVHNSVARDFLRGKYVRKAHGKAGLDVGIEKYSQLSDGVVINNPLYLAKYSDKLAKQQKVASREQEKLKVRRKSDPKAKPNSKHKRAKAKVAVTHAKIRHLRENHSWQSARLLAQHYDFLTVESLDISEMVKNSFYAKSISDAAWGGFLSKLSYYMDSKRFGGELVAADQWFASTQSCFRCGVKTKHGTELRVFTCSDVESCGWSIDRDLNAALNLLNWGVALRCKETINGPLNDYYNNLLVECKTIGFAQEVGVPDLVAPTRSGLTLGFTSFREPSTLLPF